MECKLIKEIGRRDLKKGPLCNLTDGGEGVSGSIVQIGDKNPFYGKRHKMESFQHVTKAVKQLTMEGIYINSFYSISIAAKSTNSKEGKIRLCTNGNRKSHNGFKWEFVNSCDAIIEESDKFSKRTNFKYIEQIDIITDKVIGKHKSITLVSKQLNISKANIINCLKGRRNTCGGFKWRYVMKTGVRYTNEYYDDLIKGKSFYRIENYINTNTRIKHSCKKCNCIIEKTPKQILNGFICKCSSIRKVNKNRLTNEDYINVKDVNQNIKLDPMMFHLE